MENNLFSISYPITNLNLYSSPSSITGGASVGFQLLNKDSRQYFQRAISISGTPITYFALQDTNNHTDLLIKVAERDGQNIATNAELVEYLQTVDVDEITKNGPQFPFERTLRVAWGPTVEGDQKDLLTNSSRLEKKYLEKKIFEK